MPRWIPENKWEGEEVFIIGGGDSLRYFDWSLLKPLLTIGCNDAYLHGKEICKLCIFGDSKWFEIHKNALEKYKGIVFTNCPQLHNERIPWLWKIGRESRGLHHNSVAWNKNTGASAVNLALILGAKTVYLLGFDMQLSEKGESNWHENTLDKPDPDIYSKFIEGFGNLVTDLNKFPGTEIINITDNSEMDLFPKIGVEEFWSSI